MKLKEKKRSSADLKRDKIIGEARKLFVQQGFAATSMAMIAQQAGVPKSLLFHHFATKQNLWKLVKQDIIKTVVPSEFQLDLQQGLTSFIRQIVELRFASYSNNPDLIRLMAWQALEKDQTELLGGAIPGISPDTWAADILTLQQQGKLRTDMSVKMIIVFIASSTAGIFTSGYDSELADPVVQNLYKEKIIDCLVAALQAVVAKN